MRPLRAQFGPVFKVYRTLRIRRNELEYPAYPGDLVEEREAQEAITQARGLIDATEQLMPHLGIYRGT